jgi:hypothetical protein
MFDLERSVKNHELWQKYHVLQDEVERLYRNKDYKAAKLVCLEILKDINTLKETGEFDNINKPFADYAIIMSTASELDDTDRQILKVLFSEDIVTLKGIVGLLSFDSIGLAEQFFHFLKEIAVLSEDEAEEYISNARENDGEVILPDPEAEKGLELLEQRMLAFLADNQPILQKNFLVAFRAATPNPWEGLPGNASYALQDIFYHLLNAGKIRREKTGRSFSLFVA